MGSWIDRFARDPSTSRWLASVEDFDKRLEGEIGELDERDMEDAQNELIRDQNDLPREVIECELRSRKQANIPFSTLEFTCPQCRSVTCLPPAAPTVKRMETPGHLHFSIHGEHSDHPTLGVTSLLKEGGVYHCQWRGFDPLTNSAKSLGPDDGWLDPKKLIKRSSTISKKNLKPYNYQWQVRVRARLGPCLCGKGGSPPP